MGVDVQTRKDGTRRFSFVVYDAVRKKNMRVPQGKVPEWVKDEGSALEYFHALQAEFQTNKLRIAQQQAWKEKFYDFTKLVELYKQERQKNAPRSWQVDLFWLESYALPFFLRQEGGNNVNNWETYFEAFRDHLETVRPIKAGQKKLAYNSMNKVIKATNLFLVELARKNLCKRVGRIPVFAKKHLRTIKVKDLYTEPEITALSSFLRNVDQDAADMFDVLANTGLRVSEAAGLSLNSLKKGLPASAVVRQWLGQYKIECVGYLYVDSQVARDCVRSELGVLQRLPLKKRPSIDVHSARTVPIEDKKLFNMLVARYKAAEALRKTGKYGPAPQNYLLFPEFGRSSFANRVRKACQTLNLAYRSPHKLRHSYATRLCARTGGHQKLVQLVLGHKKTEITDNYVHLFELIQEDMQKDIAGQAIDFVA